MRLTNKCPTRSLAILRFALPAQVVKLVDTLASGASARKGVEVQVLSWAPFPLLFLQRISHRRGRYGADTTLLQCVDVQVMIATTENPAIETH